MKTPCACAVLLPLALTLSALAQSTTPPARPDAVPPKDEVVQLEAFTVTGSNIRRVHAETAVPVTVVDAAELDARGASTMADFVETLGMAEISGVTEIASGAQAAKGDAALVDLRGLGSGSSLVLINGRRMAPHAISMAENGVPALAPNLNAIPRALISRIEVLRDGASAIYGADAAAGVINNLVSRTFVGRGVTLRMSDTQHGGAGEVNLTAYDSFKRGDTHLAVSFDHFRRDGLASRDRSFSRNDDQRLNRALPAPWNGQPVTVTNPDGSTTVVRDNDFANTSAINQWGQWQRGFIQPDYLTFIGSRPTGNVGITTSTTPPAGVATMSNAGMFYLVPTADGGVNFKQTAPSKNIDSPENLTFANGNDWRMLIPNTQRTQFAAFLDRDLKNGLSLFGDFLFYHAHSTGRRPGADFKNSGDPGIYMPASNPYNPFGVRFYHPTGLPNADGTPRLVGTPADVSLWNGVSNGMNTNPYLGIRPREYDVYSYAWRALAGLRGRFGQSWEWESGIMAAGSYTKELEHYMIRESRLRLALLRTDATAYNPFPVTFKIVNNQIVVDKLYDNPASVIEPLYDDEDRLGRAGVFVWDAKANGRLMRLFQGGEIGVAAGTEVRYETYSDKRSAFVGLNPPGSGAQFPILREDDNDIVNLSANVPIDAKQWVYAAYAEVALPFIVPENKIPLVRSLELTGAGRYEYFSIFGRTAKPKVSLLWSPLEWLKLRASVAESFRAPNLVQTNTASLSRRINSEDPYRFEATRLSSDDTQRRLVYRRGNDALIPEEARSTVAGLVLDVPKLRGLSVTFDYFKIDQDNVIENVGAQNVLDKDETLLILATQAKLASGTPIDQIDLGSGTAGYLGNPKVTRLPVTSADRAAFAAYNANPANTVKRAVVGEFVSLVDDYINLSGRRIQGYEIGLQYRFPKQRFGQFNLRADTTRYVMRTSQSEAGAVWLDELGRNGRAKWRASASLNWRLAAWSAGWFTSYFGGFVDTSAATTEAVYNALGKPGYIAAFNDNGIARYLLKVEPYIQHNAWLSYRFKASQHRWLKDVSVRVGVNNVFDTEPPLADEGFGFFTGSANPRGRQFSLELARKF
jgi:iron complex outermembrane receptor protein